jgi:predicted acylesterase/phospholipase RssA
MSTKDKPSLPKYELVLGGGGIKGYGHIGVLKAIHERDIKIGMVTGVSIGSAVAAMYRNGYCPDDALDILLKEFTIFNKKVIGKGKKPTSATTMLSLLSGIDLLPFFQDVMTRYHVTPRRNLRIIAFDALQMRPVVFEGLKYDIATAVAASCSIPVVMRPVWTGNWKKGRTGRTIIDRVRGKVDETVLVDGGVYHPAPHDFCKGPAIISRLGIASQMPTETYDECSTWAEYVFQSIEVAAGRFIHRHFPDGNSGHTVINSGKPDVGTLTFGICREQALGMVDYGYKETHRVLDLNKLGTSPKSK